MGSQKGGAAPSGPRQQVSEGPSLGKKPTSRDGNESSSRPSLSLNRSASGPSTHAAKAVGLRCSQLDKEFSDNQRTAVEHLLNRTRDLILQNLEAKKQQNTWPQKRIKKSAFARTPEGPFNAAEAKELAKVKYKIKEQGQMTVLAKRLGKQGGVPPYKSWSYLMRNEQANETGGRVFYTDATGETIPASDSEDENAHQESQLEGAGRERSMWVMQRLVREAGAGREAVAALAKRFHASEDAVKARLEAIQAGGAAEPNAAQLPVPHTNFRHELDKALTSFCRRCRIYNCVTHAGPHVRPQKKRPYLPDPREEPCSATCWRLIPEPPSQAMPAALTPGAGAPMQHTTASPSRPSSVTSAPGLAAALPAASAPAETSSSPKPGSGSAPEAAAPGAAAGGGNERPPMGSGVRAATGGTDSAPDEGSKGDVAESASAAAPARAPQQPPADALKQILASAPRRRRSPEPVGSMVDLCSSDSDGGVQSPRGAASPTEPPSGAESWSEYELSLLNYGAEMFKGDACRTARMVASKTCTEVYRRMKQLMPNLPAAVPASPLAGTKRKGNAPQKRKNATQVVLKRHRHEQGKPWPAYTPCQCVGGCGASCPCLKSKNFCEKFCGCSPAKCGIRFQGCDCKSGCRSKTCPCFAAGHECDTDLCKGCTKSLLGVAEAAGGAKCCNMRLRFRQHKRVAMGLSNVAGWGSFLLEQAYKGDLLGEYTGELVNQQEADRRGKAYDRDDNSYLFNLNEDWVIDARRRGNKLRFANHSTDPNCNAKILLVDGDHRVGIYARKDIPPGTELTYDYCYATEHAPSWAKSRRQSRKTAQPVAAQAQKLATG